MHETNTLLSEVREEILILTLNRPKVNALNLELIAGLLQAFRKAERDRNIRCVLLAGAGHVFSAGQDLIEFRQVENESGDEVSIRGHLQHTYNPLVVQIRQLPKPVIAAINGSVSGAALGLALACDLRIATEQARFVVGFGGIGLAPDSAVSLLLPAVIGFARATEFTFTNKPINAEQALNWGLVNRVVPAERLDHEAFLLASQLAGGPIGAMGLAKRAFNKAILSDLERVLDYESHLQEIARRSIEHKEGLDAFLEKRSAKFLG
jgi:2-(1,2-epoxy-1,2-dihydrophenyl)acetyl-CoA isomerase